MADERRRGPTRPSLPHARPGSKAAVERELRHHLEEKIDRLVEQGMSPEDARREAERAFGDLQQVKSEVEAVDRTAVPLKWLARTTEVVLRDLALAVRSMVRERWLAAAVIATLGVGIGATVAIFSVVEAVMLRPFPFDEPDRIVYLSESNLADGRVLAVAPANYLDWHDRLRSYEAMAATTEATILVSDGGDAERVPAARVSADYFRVIGVQPVLGRTFTAEEDSPGGNEVAVVSHEFWRTRLGADPDAVGTTFRMDGIPHTIVGVMPPGLRAYTRSYSVAPIAIWRPYAFQNDPPDMRDARRLGAIARLRDGVTVEQAEAELKAVAAALAEEYPVENEGRSAMLSTLPDTMRDAARTPVLVLFGAVGFILLIACLNVGSLVFARADARRNAMTLRRALGASRAAIVRQLLAESLVLSVAGAGVGVVAAQALLPLVVRNSPVDVTRMGDIGINGTVLAFSLGLGLLTAVLTGLVPAIGFSNPDLVDELKQGGYGRTEGRRARTARSSLVVAEVALCTVLVVGAGLMTGTYLKLTGLDLGFEPEGIVRAGTLLPRGRYTEPAGTSTYPGNESFAVWRPTPEETAFMEGVEERLAQLPGVRSVAAGNFDPIPGMLKASSAWPEGTSDEDATFVAFRAVSPGWFETLELPIVRGRPLTEEDRRSPEDVVVIDESAARTFWPDRDPVGERIMLADGQEDQPHPFRIVGVAGASRISIFDNSGQVLEEEIPVVYVPYRRQFDKYVDFQIGFRLRSVFLVKTDRKLGDIAPDIRRTIASFDSELPVTVVPLTETVSSPLSERRFYMGMLMAFGMLTLLLVASGVFAVMAYSVSRKTRELGIRLALGARAPELKRAELLRGARLAVLGILVGGAGAVWLSRFIASFLYGVTTVDPWVYSVVAALIVAVVLAAAYVPARRAALSDPMTSLRTE